MVVVVIGGDGKYWLLFWQRVWLGSMCVSFFFCFGTELMTVTHTRRPAFRLGRAGQVMALNDVHGRPTSA